MEHFRIIKFYSKDFYEAILAYTKARLLLDMAKEFGFRQ